MATLIEHLGGNFPLWLAPIQIAILPIGDAHHAFASEVNSYLTALDVRTELHLESESLGKKIRATKVAKIPYTLVIGNQEVSDKTVTLESREKGKVGTLTVDNLLRLVSSEIVDKK